MQATGAILAGGKSSRMGTPKSLLEIQGKTVVEHIRDTLEKICSEVIIIANDVPAHEIFGVPVYADLTKDKGPLGGLEAALFHGNYENLFIAACDMPYIDPRVYLSLARQLNKADAAIPIHDGRFHPLSGIYTKSILESVQELLKADSLSMRSLFSRIDVQYVEQFPGIDEQALQKHFFNMNTPEDYQQAKTLLEP